MKAHTKNKKINSKSWKDFFDGPKYKINKIVIDGMITYKMEALCQNSKS